MSKEKFSRQFGDAVLVGDNGEAFFSLSLEDQARAQGWSEACPVVERLIKPAAEGGRGAEVMRNRYGEINFWFAYIRDTLKNVGKVDLATELYTPKSRGEHEPMGTHDAGWPPEELETHYFRSPMAYALPRILAESAKMPSNDPTTQAVFILEFLDESIAQSQNATELAVLFAEKVVIGLLQHGKRNEAGLLFRHLVSSGKLKEDNTDAVYVQIFEMMEKITPQLYSFYTSLTDEEKKTFRILDRSQLRTTT